jgi:hypothetical protein
VAQVPGVVIGQQSAERGNGNGRWLAGASEDGGVGHAAALAAHIVENPVLNGATIRLDGAIRMAPALRAAPGY